MKNERLYKIKSAILGHAIGDALGVPVEFCTRKKLDSLNIRDMMGYGVFPYPAGTWSDDTSMTLCALDSLSEGTLDFDHVMLNFKDWIDLGKFTPAGECFDAGRTCINAIYNHFARNHKSTESGGTSEHSNGNVSLMRILPFVLFHYYSCPQSPLLPLIHDASALTHRHPRSKIGCGIYAIIAEKLLVSPTKQSIEEGLRQAKSQYNQIAELSYYERIFDVGFADIPREEIRSTGYIVDTLEAALWCIATTDNYRDCVLKAVNLGGDTDTIAAVAGGLAGLLYGYNGIPIDWLKTLQKRDYIEQMCKRAAENWTSRD